MHCCLTRTDVHFHPDILEMGYIQLTIAIALNAMEIQVRQLQTHSHELSHVPHVPVLEIEIK